MLFRMTVGFFYRSHAPDISVKMGADVIQFMENDPELLFPGKVEKPRHVKIDNVQAGMAVIGYFRDGVESAAVAARPMIRP